MVFVFALLLGPFGAHRFISGKWKSGLAQLFTLGGLGIWWLIDLIRVLAGKFSDRAGRPLANPQVKITCSLAVLFVVCTATLSAGLMVDLPGGMAKLDPSVAEWKQQVGVAYGQSAALGIMNGWDAAAFKKLAGKPAADVTIGGTEYWIYRCQDGEVQLSMDAALLRSTGKMVGQFGDYAPVEKPL